MPECQGVRSVFIFRLRLSAAFNLLAQMKGIQKRLPYGQADAFRQCPAVNRELCPVAPGKRRLIAHPVGFVIDDNKPPVLHKNAVRNALHKHLLVGDFSRQPFVAFAAGRKKVNLYSRSSVSLCSIRLASALWKNAETRF